MNKRKLQAPKPAQANKKRRRGAPSALPEESFPIVGMGASAGGLEALTSFFNNMPADSHMAFVLVPHLDPGHVSMMPELLKRYTSMDVIEAQNGMTVGTRPRLRDPSEQGHVHRRQGPADRFALRNEGNADAHRFILPLPGRRPG